MTEPVCVLAAAPDIAALVGLPITEILAQGYTPMQLTPFMRRGALRFAPAVDASCAAVASWAPERSRERPCLTCRRPFRSEGPHNRMCRRCREKSEGLI